MDLGKRLRRLEKAHAATYSPLLTFGEFSFGPDEEAPDLPDDHPARGFVDVLKAMDASVVGPTPA